MNDLNRSFLLDILKNKEYVKVIIFNFLNFSHHQNESIIRKNLAQN